LAVTPPDAAARSRAIRAEALRLGFTRVGIAPAEALDPARRWLAHWIAEGRHGQMQYLEGFASRHARFLEQLPGLRSFIVVAASYYAAPPTPASHAEPIGRVARYAAGRDYHAVLLEQLDALADAVRALVDRPILARCCVDTAPIHERSLAAAAGLGFIGKNTCLILPRGGSWVVLGAIATDLELAPDAPVTHSCGACTRCLEACPTGALTAPYEMDARRCIAYLTLEHRGPIADHLKPQIGPWVAGCDICQEVCPYNAQPATATWKALTPAAGAGQGLHLPDLLCLDSPEAFRVKFGGTAVTRPRYEGLVRNAAIAAGNSGDPSLLPLLQARTDDPDPTIREAARWAVRQLTPDEVPA